MDTPHNELLPAGFAGNSRVWVYQSHRPFAPPEALQIERQLESFVIDWKSHGTPVKGWASLFYNQFIVLMADETASGVSGCSTDSSVRLIKQIEKDCQVQLFDRLSLAFFIDGKVQLVLMAQLPQALEKGLINENVLYFNNTIQTKAELETAWLIPIKNSWLGERYLHAVGK